MFKTKDKCGICKKKIKVEEPMSVVIRANNTEQELKICEECATLLDVIETRVSEKFYGEED